MVGDPLATGDAALGVPAYAQLRCLGSVTPGQQVGDPYEHPSEPSPRIDAVELGGLDQSEGDGGRLAAADRTRRRAVR